LYREAINTTPNKVLDSKDGLRNVLDSMNSTLGEIGFNNETKKTAQEAMGRLTSEEYMRSLAEKTTEIDKRLQRDGLSTSRLDSFTVSIDGESKNGKIYVSNNPIDIMSAQPITDRVGEQNIGVLSAPNQDKLNDFVMYTSNYTRGGSKGAIYIGTYDPKTDLFYHHSDGIGRDTQGLEDLRRILTEKLKSERKQQKELSSNRRERTFADSQVYEIKAMISDKLKGMQKDAEERVKGGKDPLSMILERGSAPFDNEFIRQNFGDVIEKAMAPINENFMTTVIDQKSMAPNSPAHQILLDFRGEFDTIVKTINDALVELTPHYKKMRGETK
jgi:hypothetical protein